MRCPKVRARVSSEVRHAIEKSLVELTSEGERVLVNQDQIIWVRLAHGKLIRMLAWIRSTL
jgi:hypothetical protein